MDYLSQKKGFLGLDANQNIVPRVIIVPFGLEKTVSYGGGTRNGPKEIIKASHQVELFDEELNKEPYKEIGIKTLKPFAIKNKIGLCAINPKFILIPINAPITVGISETPNKAYVFLKTLFVAKADCDELATSKLFCMVIKILKLKDNTL